MYEGQGVVVKLAPIDSDRAEALITEIVAYQKLKEFWGKYVPRLVSYGTIVGRSIVYIATEEIKGYDIGIATFSHELMTEVCHALAVVHGCGILHGDICPSNILVAKGQQLSVRLIDFGFARFDPNGEDCEREFNQLAQILG